MSPPPTAGQDLFVGRERELRLIRQQREAAMAGRWHAVMLSGEPGIGKSRLLGHAMADAAARGWTILRRGASEAEGMPPYLPFLEAVGRYVREADLEVLRGQVGSSAPILAGLFVELGDRLAQTAAPYDLPPEQARLRLFDEVTHFLGAIAETAPLALLLDDLQWADSSTLDLLVLGAYREGGPDANLVLARSLAEMDRQRIQTRISLETLASESIRRLAVLQFDGDIDDELDSRRYLQSGGNRFFAEELLRGWLETATITLDGDAWRLIERGDRALPTSIREAVHDRVSRLPAETADLLNGAAVIGRTFDISALARIRDIYAEAAEQLLLPGLRARLIRDGGRSYFSFAHDTIRECLYSGVGPARRRRLHEQIGQYLEETGSGEEAGIAELAFHYVRGESREKGIFYSVEAASIAEASYATEEAVEHYRSAIELLSGDERKRDLLVRLGFALLLAGREQEAANVFATSHRLAIRQDNAPAAARASHGLGLTRWRVGDLPGAQTALEASVALLAGASSPETVRVLVDLAALMNAAEGTQAAGLEHARHALACAEQLGDRRLEVSARRILGQLLAWSNQIPAGIELLEPALVLAIALDEPAEAAEICGILSNLSFATLDTRRSPQVTALRMELAERFQQPYELRHVHAWMAEIAMQDGDWPETERFLADAQLIVDGLASPEPVAVLHRVRGRMAYYRGHYAEAEECFAGAVAIARPMGPQHLAWYLGELGLAQLALNKTAETRSCLQELEAIVDRLPAGSLSSAPALCDLVEMASGLGEISRAARWAERLRPFEGRMFLSLVDCVLGTFEVRRQEWPAAARYLERAEQSARQAGLRPALLATLEARIALERARNGPASPAVQALTAEAL